MLSILIPIYNADVREFVSALQFQCTQTEQAFEIICLDDASSSSFKHQNRSIIGLQGVKYEELSENIGRAAIRNRLADMAAFPFLLFMDCDGAVVRDDFIQTYLSNLSTDVVLCGGRIYAAQAPEDAEYLLHWTYGHFREALSAAKRSQAPWHAFMTNNFVIPRQLFLDIGLDERLRHYGHEDTLLGMQLKQRRILVKHLDNPLLHLGLETTDRFLEKTAQATKNLVWLMRQPGIQIESKLSKVVEILWKSGLQLPLRQVMNLISPVIIRQLHTQKPSLILFDIFKLQLALNE
jgi:glycosyltransferase involved in cell wall biosynthesis